MLRPYLPGAMYYGYKFELKLIFYSLLSVSRQITYIYAHSFGEQGGLYIIVR